MVDATERRHHLEKKLSYEEFNNEKCHPLYYCYSQMVHSRLRYFKVLWCSLVRTNLKWDTDTSNKSSTLIDHDPCQIHLIYNLVMIPNMTLMYKTTTEVIESRRRQAPNETSNVSVCRRQTCARLFSSNWTEVPLKLLSNWKSSPLSTGNERQMKINQTKMYIRGWNLLISVSSSHW